MIATKGLPEDVTKKLNKEVPETRWPDKETAWTEKTGFSLCRPPFEGRL